MFHGGCIQWIGDADKILMVFRQKIDSDSLRKVPNKWLRESNMCSLRNVLLKNLTAAKHNLALQTPVLHHLRGQWLHVISCTP